ncbi:MAG TPA: hypothetical protein VN937_23390 [Blastocatellia bacterium]|nr:hypothetical protein [Blastocatellia bacterium]
MDRSTYTAILVFAILLAPLSTRQCFAQQPKETHWDSFRFLLGEWVGEGSGAPGEGAGGFSFTFDLQGKILVRKNTADYPATKDKPAYSHTDLMVIYREADDPIKAIYFDNEGHVIHYAVSFSKDQSTLTFLSNPSPSSPRFRFIYSKATPDKLKLEFDIAPPGKPEAFSKYVEGSAHRKPASR